MNKLNIDLNIISNLPHISNIISGYILLSEQKK